MKLSDCLVPFFVYLLFLLSTVLCLAPAKNHLRVALWRAIFRISALSILLSAVLSVITVWFSIDYTPLYLPAFALMFLVYHKSLTLHISQSVFLFLLACAFMSFLGNFSILFDAYLHPTGALLQFSPTACIFLLVIGLLFCGIAVYPLAKYGAFLIDNLQQPQIWWVVSLVSAVFFLFNQRMIVHRYSTIHTNSVGIAYGTVMGMMFVLLLLLCVIFYYIVSALIKKAEAEGRNRILEMQEKQYSSLQRYLDADAKARHDFRQTIYTLHELSSQKDYSALEEYLSRYIEALPKKESVDYCKEPALNALLNHYVHRAGEAGIRTELQIRLPEVLRIDRVDLCSIIGNLLENALAACRSVPEGTRFCRVVLSEEQGNELYIAISNSFGGRMRQGKGRYLSTHRGGTGIGLLSVAATAERYGGTADFSNDSGVFYSNVMLINQERKY